MFDVSTLSARDQFEAAVIVSGVCLAAAVLLREWFADREIRIMARVLGLAGWAVVVTFAWRMTETNETLATQIMVKGKKDATQISDLARVVAVASEFSCQYKGQKFTLTKYTDGKFGSVSSSAGRRESIYGCRDSGSDRCSSGCYGACSEQNGGFGNVPTGEHGRRF